MYFRFDKKKKDRTQLVNGLNFMLNRESNTIPAFVLCMLLLRLVLTPAVRETSYDNNGWNIYNPEREYARFGVNPSHQHWRVSCFNKDWKEIPSYPEYIVVPRLISDSALVYDSFTISFLTWDQRCLQK